MIYNIEDLSTMLRPPGVERARGGSLDEPDEDDSLELQIVIEEQDSPPRDDATPYIVDALTDEERLAYRFEQGCELRYRVGVLGVGKGVEGFYRAVDDLLGEAADPLSQERNLWAHYQVGLFGGRPNGPLARGDAEVLADRLDLFRPNYLALVNAGAVKNKFADRSAHQLALLTRHINSGAMRGQSPYSLVFVTDTPIPEPLFREYRATCRRLDTHPAGRQFRLDQVDRMADDIRAELGHYARAVAGPAAAGRGTGG